jgi:hypothetical protein
MLTLLLPLAQAASPVATQTVVATLHRSGRKACTPGEWEPHWLDVHLQAGWLDLIADEGTLLPYVGRPLVLEGHAGPVRHPIRPVPRGLSTEGCPVPQLRSDMIETPDGIRQRRGLAASLPERLDGLTVTRATPFDGLTAQAHDGGVQLAFTLPGLALRDLGFVAHYEGCAGKPGAHEQIARHGVLGPGATARATFPFSLDRAPRHRRDASTYRLTSVRVEGTGPELWVAIDLPVSALGVDVPRCR